MPKITKNLKELSISELDNINGEFAYWDKDNESGWVLIESKDYKWHCSKLSMILNYLKIPIKNN